MPCGYHINADEGLITISGTEDVPLQEAIALGEELLDDRAFESSLPHLVDLRGLVLTRTSAESEDFRDFVLDYYRPIVAASVAVLVDDSLDRGSLAALYHLTCRMDRTELFDDFEQALKWLVKREFVEPIRL